MPAGKKILAIFFICRLLPFKKNPFLSCCGNVTIFLCAAQVSYGEMIGCDNQDCPIEWFHFGCMVSIIPATVLPLIPL
jgi:hypothetical protein